MNRRLFTIVLCSLGLGVTLLIQRSMTTYYAYRCSELEQDKKDLVKQLHSLDVEIRMASRNEVLYQYWAERREEFDFKGPVEVGQPLVEKNKANPHARFSSLEVQP